MDFDSAGRIHVAYVDFLNSSNRLYYTTNAGGTWTTTCTETLLDAQDYDVDADDLAIFLGCFSGPGTLAEPDCAG